MKRKVKLKMNAYGVVSDAVETGVRVGLNRAFKYCDTITERERLIEYVCNEVMNALCEVVNFDG